VSRAQHVAHSQPVLLRLLRLGVGGETGEQQQQAPMGFFRDDLSMRAIPFDSDVRLVE